MPLSLSLIRESWTHHRRIDISKALTRAVAAIITIAPMPTYEYGCEKCGHQFEIVQPISAAPLSVCPKEFCAQKKWSKGRVKRRISAGGGLIFKGSGFYITDYRSEKYKEAAKKEASAAKPAESGTKSDGAGSATKSDSSKSKPAAKPAKASGD